MAEREQRKDSAKHRFAEAIGELLQTCELDRISVTDIVTESGLTRQTFYRHFQDKYDLVNWYFERLAEVSFKQMGVSLPLYDALVKKFHFLLAERRFFSQAFKSRDRNSLVHYDYEMILHFYAEIIHRKTGQPLSPEVQFLLEMYCRGSIEMTVEWATSGMSLPPESMAQLLLEAIPPKLRELLADLYETSGNGQVKNW